MKNWSGIVSQTHATGARSHSVSVTESIDKMIDACLECGLFGQTLYFTAPQSQEAQS